MTSKNNSSLTYECPVCKRRFLATELQQPAGVGGGSYCPICQARVRVSFPYSGLVAAVGLMIALGLLYLVHVTDVFAFLLGIVVIWVPHSLFLNVASMRYKPATLKKWKERRRTIFEWLYDRDAPKDLFPKK